jgi:hypothetical protein
MVSPLPGTTVQCCLMSSSFCPLVELSEGRDLLCSAQLGRQVLLIQHGFIETCVSWLKGSVGGGRELRSRQLALGSPTVEYSEALHFCYHIPFLWPMMPWWTLLIKCVPPACVPAQELPRGSQCPTRAETTVKRRSH